MEKVDVIINVYGKPWQTLCTLKSLMKESGQHIDKIYYVVEKTQPNNENMLSLINEFDNIISYTPDKYQFINFMGNNVRNENDRYVFRYQYGIEKSDKKYVFITHNDILYTGDIIGNMLESINDEAGIGLIGQCWNCPAHSANLCDGDRFNSFKPTYLEAINLSKKYPPARITQHDNLISKSHPMPMPECRLNEFACLIDREITMIECNKNTPFFGAYDHLDLGGAWFRSLLSKGYKFKNYDINKDSKHLYFANNVAGYQVQLNHEKYINSENFAEVYYKENYKIN